jgi:hypothetical protein
MLESSQAGENPDVPETSFDKRSESCAAEPEVGVLGQDVSSSYNKKGCFGQRCVGFHFTVPHKCVPYFDSRYRFMGKKRR